MFKIAKIRLFLVFGLLLVIFTATVQCESPKMFDLDFKNADLKDVLRVLALQGNANFLIDDEVIGSVTLHLTKVTFEEALNIIAQTNNLKFTKENNIYHISQIDKSVLNVDYTQNLLTVEAVNAKLTLLLQEISQKAGINLVSAPDLKKRITISFVKIPLDNAIETILIQANCTSEKDGAIIFVREKTTSQQPFTVTYQNGLLSIDAQNVPISSLTRALTEKTGVSIVPNQDVANNISIFIQNLTLTEALTVLCSSNNLQLVNEGQAWRITRGASGSATSGININYDSNNQLFDLEIQSAQITVIVAEMARKADLNIVILAQVNWTINNIRLRKVKFTQALDYLLKGSMLTYSFANNTYLVGDGLTVRPDNAEFSKVKAYTLKYLKADLLLNTLPPIFPRQDFMLLADKNTLVVTAPESVQKLFTDYLAQVDIDDNQDHTIVIKIKYLKADDVLKYIPAAIPKTDLMAVKETNSITVTGPQNLINQVTQYIEKIDQINPLIVFNVMVVEIQDTKGFNWTPPSGSYEYNGNIFTIGPNDPTVSYGQPQTMVNPDGTTTTQTPLFSLTDLITDGKAKILSNPTITTLNGYPTSFSVATKRTYTVPAITTNTTTGQAMETPTTQTLESGLYITITPWVADDMITMEVKPKISEYGAIPQNATLPETTEHDTGTTVRIRNKQTVIISGLKDVRKEDSISKIPVLGDIPLLGVLFKQKTVSDITEEFVIIITPTLVYNDTDQTNADKSFNDKFSPEFKEGEQNQNATTPDSKKKGK